LTGPSEARIPTYVGLGARKAGTTLLHTWLADHPDVCVPVDRKEVEFFSRYYDRGLDWYRSLFDPTTERAVGEFSVGYLESQVAIVRLARDLPEVKCIVSLRDPVDRLDSYFRDLARINGYRGDLGALVAAHPAVVERGRYGSQLGRVFAAFPPEQVHVVVFEEMVAAPEAAARELYGFVGVDDTHVPATLGDRLNVTAAARSPALQRVRQRVKRVAIDHDLRWLLRLARSGPGRGLQSLNAAPDQRPSRAIDPALARELRRTYEEDIRSVSELLGRNMEDVWRAGAS
jgi:hypothetical protein